MKRGAEKVRKVGEICEDGVGKDLMFWILMAGLIALPIAGTMLHIKIHAKLTYLTYITLFDAVIISLLYLSRKTIFYGFMLNTTLFIVGVIAHFYSVGFKGTSDVLLSIPDFSIGYALWEVYK